MYFKNNAETPSWRTEFRKWIRNFLCSSLMKLAVASFLYLFLKSEDLEAWKTAYEIVDFFV